MKQSKPMRDTRQRHPPSTAPQGRRGAILILGIVCLIVVSAVGQSLIRSALVQRRQAQRAEQRLQCEWLAEAGIERAVARLAADEEYTGDAWQPPSDQLFGQAGRVTVQVEKGERPERRTIVATAEYPLDTPQRMRTMRTIPLDHE